MIKPQQVMKSTTMNVPTGKGNTPPRGRAVCNKRYEGVVYEGRSWRQMVLNFIRIRCRHKCSNVQAELIAFIPERVTNDTMVITKAL